MKDTDNATKKLIKNIISLWVSALVLIAATVAWFVTSTDAKIDGMGTSVMSVKINLEYYTTTTAPTETLDWDEDDLIIRGEETSGSVQDYFDNIDAGDWTSADSMDIDPLYPGEFRVYRMDFTASRIAAVFSLLDVGEETDDVYSSIYTFTSAKIINAETKESSDVAPHVASLKDALNGGNTAQLLDISSANPGDSVSIYYLIGIPGTDKNGTHDAIRETGASVSIGTAGLDGSSSEEETPETD